MTRFGDIDWQAARARTALEAAGWALLISLLWGADYLAKLGEAAQSGSAKTVVRLAVEQATSALAALLLVPFVIRWLRLFPLSRAQWASAVVGHTAGTVLFAFGHYSLMVAYRYVWYRLMDLPYIWREPFVGNLIVEYQ